MTRVMTIQGVEVTITNRYEGDAPVVLAYTLTNEEADRLLYETEEFIKEIEEEIKRTEYGFIEILKIEWFGLQGGDVYREVKYKA